MISDQLRAMHRAVPFIPFDIAMADGSRYHVPHPEFLAYAPGSRTCGVYSRKNVIRVLDLLLMTALEPREPKARRRKAG